MLENLQNPTSIEVLPSRFPVQRLRRIGRGAYGVVYEVEIKGKRYALKRNFVDNNADFSGSVRELDTLVRLAGHPYIVTLKYIIHDDNFTKLLSPLNRKYLQDDSLHFVTELASYDGSKLPGTNTSFGYLKFAMVQLLLALEYMHSKGITHRDLKLTNTLWFKSKQGRAIKVSDFGLSKPLCGVDINTPKVATSWYRAPEIILKHEGYQERSDIWSMACVFYEMVMDDPLLRGCEDNNSQLISTILKLLPCHRSDKFKEMLANSALKISKNLLDESRKSWTEVIKLTEKRAQEFDNSTYKKLYNPGKLADFIDLLQHMFVLDPQERFTATEALQHKFFEGYRSLIDQIRKDHPPYRAPIPHTIIRDRPERIIAGKLALDIYDRRQGYNWYQHRILFLALDIFDRYLAQHEKTLTNELITIHFNVALYISIKYYTSMRCPCKFEELLPMTMITADNIVLAKNLEGHYLREVLQWQVYRETIYEMSNYYRGITSYVAQWIPDMLTYYSNIVEYQGNMLNIFQQFLDKGIDLPEINIECEETILPKSWPKINFTEENGVVVTNFVEEHASKKYKINLPSYESEVAKQFTLPKLPKQTIFGQVQQFGVCNGNGCSANVWSYGHSHPR